MKPEIIIWDCSVSLDTMLPKPAQQQLSVAARNAEALFEAKTVGEIRQVGRSSSRHLTATNLPLMHKHYTILAWYLADRGQDSSGHRGEEPTAAAAGWGLLQVGSVSGGFAPTAEECVRVCAAAATRCAPLLLYHHT